MSTLDLLMNEELENDSTKSERFDVRLTPRQKQILELAAQALGQSLTSFVLSSTLERALQLVREQTVTALSRRDWQTIQNLIAAPPAPTPALQKGVKRYRKQVRLRSDPENGYYVNLGGERGESSS
jgi:uncharacterized protein (DUF1778 family)